MVSRLTRVYLLVILACTLFPYDPYFGDVFGDLQVRLDHLLSLEGLQTTDFLLNVLLFIPLGFLMASRLRRGLTWTSILVVVLAMCLSFTIEAIQVFLPSRFASLADVVANGLGALLGIVACHLGGRGLVQPFLGLLRNMAAADRVRQMFVWGSYYALLFMLVLACRGSGTLSGWNDSYTLLFGNETTGDRPWRGKIEHVQFLGRSCSEDEIARAFRESGGLMPGANSLIGSYRFESDEYQDDVGLLPELAWQGHPRHAAPDSGLLLDGESWLETTGSAAALTRGIVKSNQFTINASLAAQDTNQSGPARIVTLSDGPYQRNFTLAQDGPDLVFRMRTPLTGDNGLLPEFVAPGVFASGNMRNLTLSYNGIELVLYVDGVKRVHSWRISAAPAVFGHFFRLDAFDLKGYHRVLIGLLFLPPTLVLSRLLRPKRSRAPWN